MLIFHPVIFAITFLSDRGNGKRSRDRRPRQAIATKTISDVRLLLKRKQGFEVDTETPNKKQKKPSIARFDQAYDHDSAKPKLHEFYPDDGGVFAGSIASLIGLRIDSNGDKISMASDARRPHTTMPFAGQLGGAHVFTREYIPGILQHELLDIGIWPLPGFFPQGQIVGRDDPHSTKWPPQDIVCPLYSLCATLLADIVNKIMEVMLESPDRTGEIAQPDLVSTNSHVQGLNQSLMSVVPKALTKRDILLMNSRFLVDVLHVMSFHLATNSTAKSHHYPTKHFRPPADDFEMLMDQELIHFHKGRKSTKGMSEGKLDIEKFRLICRTHEGIAHSIGFKRSFYWNNEAIAQIMKTRSAHAPKARERGMFKLRRDKYNRSTPARRWDRFFWQEVTRLRTQEQGVFMSRKVGSKGQEGHVGELFCRLVAIIVLLVCQSTEDSEATRPLAQNFRW